LALLKPEGGVAHYRERFDFHAYYAFGDDPEQQLYVESLTQHAQTLGKIPVFGFCRSQGRTPWFKRRCRGVNIVTLRNPWDQWCSIAKMMEQNNAYFAFRFYRVACIGCHESEYSSFFEGLSLPKPIVQTGEEAQRDAPDAYFWNMSIEKLFRVFLRVYMLDTLLSVSSADVTVDLDRLSDSADERASVTRHLRRLTGLDDLSFDDCTLPRHPPRPEAVYQAALIEASATLALFESKTGLRSPDILRAKLQETRQRF
jgi:hypothetical protein